MTTWYRNGTVTVTNGARTVTGVDTLWLMQTTVGDVFTLDGDRLYEIETIPSNTSLTLKTNYAGSTASVQTYAIIRNFTSSVNAVLAAKLADVLNKWHLREDDMLAWLMGDDTTTLTSVEGITFTVDTPQSLQKRIRGALSKTINTANVTLTASEAKNTFFTLTGTLTGNRAFIVPATASHIFAVTNATSGSFTVTVRTPSGTGIVVPAGSRRLLWCNGTNVLDALPLLKTDVGLSNVDNTSDAAKPVSSATATALGLKVDKVTGKQLSTEDYTSAEKTKLGGIAGGAQVNTVTSVATRTGAVVLAKTDVGLSNVTNDAQLKIASNLADLNNVVTARSSLGLGTAAITNTGTGAANTILGNDTRLTDSREWTGSTVSQAEAEAGTETTRRAWTAQRVRQSAEKVSTVRNDLTIQGTLFANSIASVASFSWDSATSSPAATPGGQAAPVVTNTHRKMRRCVVNDAGQVVYYLDPNDSTKKEDGGTAVLNGTDGQVMVEIPAFYAKRAKVGTVTTWSIADVPLHDFELHPAFIKGGVFVPNRYYSAYDACYWEASSGTYKSGLNLDALTVNTGADKLASVAGAYPIVGVTRPVSRSLASNRGAGWQLVDFWLVNAIQLLFLVEHQTFASQAVLGAGNTNGSYSDSSANQDESPHTVAGASHAWGNNSTDGTQPSAGASPGTAYMSYRGIENFFGNCWNAIDGFNTLDNQAFVSSNSAQFADDTSTNYLSLGAPMPATNGYPINHQDIDHAFLPAAVGGSTTTYWTDYYYQSTGWRVALFGGNAGNGGNAGALCWFLDRAASSRSRVLGARLAR